MKRPFLPLLLLTCAPVLATWVPTADSTTSAPKFTDGNFVISWNTNNKQLKYVSHDASVSTVCDMSTFSEDVDAVAGYSHPTQVAGSGFQECYGLESVTVKDLKHLYQLAFNTCKALTNVTVLSRYTPFSGIVSLPNGVRQIVFFPEQYAVAWTNALSQNGATFSAVSAADRARADYPTKLEDVMVKAQGPKFDLVPTKVKDADVLGVTNGRSRWNNAGRPYYVVQWREVAPGTLMVVK